MNREPVVNQEGAMLLSRVAESVYWAGRYIERAEATARLVHVHTELFLDLPKAAGVGWAPLLAVTGSGDDFHHRHTRASEEKVVDFLAASPEHQGSVVASIAQAHANLRVTQAVVPSEAWGVLNQLHLWAAKTRHEAVDRRTRLAWTAKLISQCQLFSGVLEGTMSHDDTYAFLQIGRGLERADMTTRVLDVQAGILLGPARRLQPVRRPDVDGGAALAQRPPDVPPYSGADGVGAGGAAVPAPGPAVPPLGRALPDRGVPRPARAVPQQRPDGRLCRAAAAAGGDRHRARWRAGRSSAAALHEYADRLQQGLGKLHQLLVTTYFQMEPSPSAVLLPA